jgi:hypothetical protein
LFAQLPERRRVVRPSKKNDAIPPTAK